MEMVSGEEFGTRGPQQVPVNLVELLCLYLLATLIRVPPQIVFGR
jgi:hypothetical protein